MNEGDSLLFKTFVNGFVLRFVESNFQLFLQSIVYGKLFLDFFVVEVGAENKFFKDGVDFIEVFEGFVDSFESGDGGDGLNEPLFTGVDDLEILFGKAVFFQEDSDIEIGFGRVFNNADEVRVVSGEIFEGLV